MAGEAAGARRDRGRRDRSEHEVEFGRIVAFSDGVLAIAITLLTLNLDVPKVTQGDSGALTQGLLDLSPHLFAYALSFAVVGRFWIIHHRFFAHLQWFDGRLMAANLVYLALIVLVPFSSDLLGTYGETSAGVIVYAATIGLAGLVNWLMVRYALREDLVRADARAATEPFGSPAALAISGACILSIPVARFSPLAAQLVWLASMFGVRRQRRAVGR
jgi:uncharacterized membrane protein